MDGRAIGRPDQNSEISACEELSRRRGTARESRAVQLRPPRQPGGEPTVTDRYVSQDGRPQKTVLAWHKTVGEPAAKPALRAQHRHVMLSRRARFAAAECRRGETIVGGCCRDSQRRQQRMDHDQPDRDPGRELAKKQGAADVHTSRLGRAPPSAYRDNQWPGKRLSARLAVPRWPKLLVASGRFR